MPGVPGPWTAAVPARTFGFVRVVWNRTLAARHERYATEGKGTSYAETGRALTAVKRQPGWAFPNEVSSVPLQQAVLRVAKMSEPLPFVWTWPRAEVASLDPASVTVTRDPARRWFVTFHVDVPDPVATAPVEWRGDGAHRPITL